MMQNYAKFDSRIAEDAMMQESMNYSSYGGVSSNISHYISNTLENIIQLFIVIFGGFILIFGLFLFLYVIISLFTKGGEKTMEELRKLLLWFLKLFKNIFSGILKFFKNILLFFWNRKIISILLIVVLCAINFGTNVIYGNSKFLRLDKINNGYVGVDLKNKKIYNPGYHLYSPIKTSYFLSPTSNFDFEIAEVTANTSEDLGVTLDYRVGFKLKDETRLDFYKKYGAKNIQLVSSDVVMPKLLEVIKGIIRNYGFKDISSKHNEIKNITLEEANKVLEPIGVKLEDVTILDIRLPKSYLTSKEDLLKAENELKLAEARLEAQKKESEKKVLEAENSKQVKIIEAEGIAEYNKIISNERITDDAIEMKQLEIERLKVEKWDGKLPTNIEGDFDL